MKKSQSKRILCAAILLCTVLSAAGCSHRHEYEKSKADATCTEGGYTLFSCNCGEAYKENETKAIGHSFEETKTEPTYVSDGYTLRRCTRCGEKTKTNLIPPLTDAASDLAEKDYLLPEDLFSRPRTANPEYVMIHFTSAVTLSSKDPYNMESIRKIFTDYEVSVHYIIDRDGTVSCWVPESLVAYHAGKGEWQNDPKYTDKMNEYAIGIELAAIGSENDMAQYLNSKDYNKIDPDLMGFTDAQYASLAALVEDICSRNHIPMDREHVIGHEEYSPAKTDPGELFDWSRILP